LTDEHREVNRARASLGAMGFGELHKRDAALEELRRSGMR
jgi:hypothetical protein